ncbi:alpha/beta hydrolase [Myxococcota bacterium]|nr:alpha/beta hydrolase [Myxococcota bacterium]
MAFPTARSIQLPSLRLPDGTVEPGIRLSVHEQPARAADATRRPAVVFSHGFPELGYSWRHQLEAVSAAGFRAVAPDQRGYGGSDRPEPISAYDIHHLCGDLVGLLDALEIDKAVFVGHDWGGFVVWAMAILHSDRVSGIVGVNTPYTPRPPMAPMALLRSMFGGQDEKMYMLWFQQPGVAEAVLDRDPALLFDKLLRTGVPIEEITARMAGRDFDMNPFRRLPEMEALGEPIGTDEERAHYADVFRRTGFGGGINWYRNFDRNWETAPEIGVAPVTAPCLMVTAAWDPVLRPEMASGMPALCPDLETVQIERCGHWTQQEKPDELNRILVDWLQRRMT